ncbi:MAG: hypothetical protein HYY93_06880, partial [Planctomycetes bacterium]|nr:hypothetical protein [Planctomycetota bacterium]
AEAAPAPPAFDAEAAVEAARRHTRRRPRVLSGRIASWLEKAIVRTLHPVWVAAEAAWNFPRAALAWGRKGLALQGGFRAQLGANLDELMYVGTGLVGCAWFMTWLVGGGVVPLLMAATFTVPPVFLLARQRAART